MITSPSGISELSPTTVAVAMVAVAVTAETMRKIAISNTGVLRPGYQGGADKRLEKKSFRWRGAVLDMQVGYTGGITSGGKNEPVPSHGAALREGLQSKMILGSKSLCRE